MQRWIKYCINKWRIINDKNIQHSTNQKVPGNHRNTDMEMVRKSFGEYETDPTYHILAARVVLS